MLAIMDSFNELCSDPVPPASLEGSLEWRARYEGLVSVAYVAGKAVAGISGPWSGKFALTWWERPLPARQLELFDSMGDAQREVEHWAMRMRVGGYSHGPHTSNLSATRQSTCAPPQSGTLQVAATRDGPKPSTSLFDRMRTLLPKFSRARSEAASSETIERLRRNQVCRDTDTGNLHFAADE
jgi:hypothetical protein